MTKHIREGIHAAFKIQGRRYKKSINMGFCDPKKGLALHVMSTSPFFVPFKNGFNQVLCCCLHVTLKRSKVPLTETMTLTVGVNEPIQKLKKHTTCEVFMNPDNLSADDILLRDRSRA